MRAFYERVRTRRLGTALGRRYRLTTERIDPLLVAGHHLEERIIVDLS